MNFVSSFNLSASQVRTVGLTLCLSICFSNVIKADNWATYQHDSAHTGRSSANFDPTLLKKVWGSTSGNTQPVVVGNNLYESHGNGNSVNPVTIGSYNLATGQKNWSTDISSGGILTYADGLLLFANRPGSGNYKMYVWDASNGTQKYVVNLPDLGSSAALPPTVARNRNNQLVAYIATSSAVTAVELGANSGTVLWTGHGSIGGQSIPTVVGDSVILAGPNQYYAFDQLTGEANHFFDGVSTGGGGITIAFDATRMQFYVRDRIFGFLTAYSYISNNSISPVWQVPANSAGGSVAIGPDGGIYGATSTGLFERDPTDGHIVKSIGGLDISNGATPVLSASSLFIWSDEVLGLTEVFDIDTFAHLATLPRGRADRNSAFQSPGAIFDNGFVSYYQTLSLGGFDVYLAIPEPSTTSLIFVAVMSFTTSKRRRSQAMRQ